MLQENLKYLAELRHPGRFDGRELRAFAILLQSLYGNRYEFLEGKEKSLDEALRLELDKFLF